MQQTMKDGVININKPSGRTSQDICAILRRRLHIKRIGHTGTLDPMATGVLPVCAGKATRIIEYYDDDQKTYHAGMRLGLTSDTLDIWGKEFSSAEVRIVPDVKAEAGSDEDGIIYVDERSIREAFAAYTGVVSQIPPKYSALRINGKRAYDLARQGTEFEIKPREITVFSNEVTSIDPETLTVEFDVTCSKGTYIRTICDDIGRTLGCGALMSSLVRTASGFFDISGAVDIDELTEMSDDEIEALIIPMEDTLERLGRIELNDNRVIAFSNGNLSSSGYRVVSESAFCGKRDGLKVYKVFNRGSFLGTAVIRGKDMIPDKVIR